MLSTRSYKVSGRLLSRCSPISYQIDFCYIRNDTTKMIYIELVEEVIKQLPLVKIIMKEFPCSWVYEGFMRWIITYITENNESPKLSEVQRFLSMSDMEIRIRTNKSYPKRYLSTIINKIFNKVRDLGGKMEYMGHAYRDNNRGLLFSNEYDDNSGNVYFGNYGIWLPYSHNGENLWNHYDISIFDQTAIGYMADFTVNDIQYSKNKVRYHESYPVNGVLHDIFNRKLRSVYGTSKIIYRGNKLYKPDENTVNYIKRIIDESNDKLMDFYVYGSVMNYRLL